MSKRLKLIFETVDQLVENPERRISTGAAAHKARVEAGKEKKAGSKVKSRGDKPKKAREPRETMRSEVESLPVTPMPKGYMAAASAIAQGGDPTTVANLSTFSRHDLSSVEDTVRDFSALHGTTPAGDWKKKYFPHLA